MMAAVHGCEKIVSLLLNSGAAVDAKAEVRWCFTLH